MGRRKHHLKVDRGSLVPAGPARVIALARRERPSSPARNSAVAQKRAIRAVQARPNLSVVVEEPPAPPAAPGLHAVVLSDPRLVHVREAGGPSDLACYTCHCGYVFRAPVSTSVICPNCEATQAW